MKSIKQQQQKKQLAPSHLYSTWWSILGEVFYFEGGGLFLPPSSICPPLHHLFSFVLFSYPVFPLSIIHFFPLFQLLVLQWQTNIHNYLFNIFYLFIYLFYFFSPVLALHFFSLPLEHLSSHLLFRSFSTYLPVSSSPFCLSASASIEGPSVPIHHALHFSLLAGINHKYFIIHHGRLSPAHRQFITAALSAGLPRRL